MFFFFSPPDFGFFIKKKKKKKNKRLWCIELLTQEDVQQGCLKACCHLRGDLSALTGFASICLE